MICSAISMSEYSMIFFGCFFGCWFDGGTRASVDDTSVESKEIPAGTSEFVSDADVEATSVGSPIFDSVSIEEATRIAATIAETRITLPEIRDKEQYYMSAYKSGQFVKKLCKGWYSGQKVSNLPYAHVTNNSYFVLRFSRHLSRVKRYIQGIRGYEFLFYDTIPRDLVNKKKKKFGYFWS